MRDGQIIDLRKKLSGMALGAVSAISWAVLVSTVQATSFVFVNQDGAGEGLNDATAAAPVGGNPGTTVGAQRLKMMVRVGEIWGSFLQSAVPIRVEVDFDPGAPPGVLAGASAISIEQNFANAPQANTWYTIALANSLAEVDLEPSANDIEVIISSTKDFYLGFDDPPSGQVGLLDVMLHELAHGLGFTSYLDEASGTFPSGNPDVYSKLVRDVSFDAQWPDLTAAQRVTSATNDPFVVWTGPFTEAAAPLFLRPIFELAVTAPPPLAGAKPFVASVFGPAFPETGISGLLVITDDGSASPGTTTDACDPLINGAAVAGNIAFVRRGVCSFDDKVYHAQLAGAVAVIIANNAPTDLFPPSGDEIVGGMPVGLTIPSGIISQADGDAIEAASPGVSLSFTLTPGPSLTGGNGGRIRLHAPGTLAPGASSTHWTSDAYPDLLMEPNISPNIDDDLDLTLTLMKDIGWNVIDIPLPHLTYETWSELKIPSSEPLSAPGDNPDGDAATNLEEYFFGSDPILSSSVDLPVIALGALNPEFTFTRTVLSTDLSWGLEKSETLSNFLPAVEGADFEIVDRIPLGTEAERITLRLLGAVPQQLFLRLRVTRIE